MAGIEADFEYSQGVVSICSPVNTALAPAMKHIACCVSSSVCLPAARRMIVAGITTRAVDIVRRMVWNGTGYGAREFHVSSKENVCHRTSLSSSGVPLMGTRAFTGKDSGCSGMLRRSQPRALVACDGELTDFATSHMRPTRSLSDSPSPRMPPEQTLIPASRTAEMVSSRSSYDLVVMTYAALSVN